MNRPALASLYSTLVLILCSLPLLANGSPLDAPPNGVACRDNTPPLQPLELDPTFAGDGRLELDLSEDAYASKGYLEDSGEAVLFGHSTPGNNPSNGEGIMQRLGVDGSVGAISKFDAGAFGCSAPRNFLTALRLQNGDYAAGGYVQPGCSGVPRYFNVLRLSPEGNELDEFDLVPFSNQLAYVFALAEQPDGKIVAVGFASQSGFTSSTYDFAVARFDLDGTLDATFANGGTFVFDLENDLDTARGLAIDSQGRILVGGVGTTAATGQDFVVLALTPTGALDPGFGTGGVFRWDRAGFSEGVSGLSLTDERILLGGTSRPDANTREMTVIGLTFDGQLDSGFSDDGVVTIPVATDVAGVADITVGPRGRIYVTGSGEFGGTGLASREGIVAVLQPGGTPDHAFNAGDPKVFSYGGLPGDLPADIELDPQGERILITGYTDNGDSSTRRFAAVRLVGLQGGMFCDGFEDDGL